MRIVDTHTHVWGEDTKELPWQSEVLPPEWDGSYTHDDLIADMDEFGVNEGVLVTTPLYGRGIRANEYTMRSIEAHPDRLYGVGLLDFFESDVKSTVRRVIGHERMLGIRMHASFDYAEIPSNLNPDADWITDSALNPVWDELRRQDAAMFIFPKAEQLSLVAKLAERHPDVSIIIDHMAWPDNNTASDEFPWKDFQTVSRYENTYVKVSSLPRSSNESWPYPDLHDYIQELLSWFGPDRLMLGSDYPWMESWGSYQECLSWIEEVDFLSSRDYSYLAHRTFDSVHF